MPRWMREEIEGERDERVHYRPWMREQGIVGGAA
jgi:hypothetical protein